MKRPWLAVILAGALLGVLAILLLTRPGVPAPLASLPPEEPPAPSPAAAPETPAPTPEPTPEPPDLRPEVEARLRAFLAEQPGRWDLCWMALPDGEPVLLSRDGEPMVSASLIKLFIMGAVYEQVEAGQIGEDAAASRLRTMITVSDNRCANELILLLGGGDAGLGMAAVNDWCARQGYAATRLNRLMLEENGLQNYSSAADCAAFLADVYRGNCVSADASRTMLELLLDQQVNDRLPARLPEGTGLAHKTGDLSGLCCADVGIVFSPGGDYILCAICNDPPDDHAARDAIAALSAELYELLNG